MTTPSIKTPRSTKRANQILALVSATLLCATGIAIANPIGITVTSNPLWTDTGLSLSAGQQVSITASGNWSWDGSYFNGPDGDLSILFVAGDFYSGAPQGALIAYTGVDPYQGHWGDASFWPKSSGYFYIGSHDEFTCLAPGELWLGFNDDAYPKNVSDNVGSVTAQVDVVPEPGALTMLLLFGATTILFRRKVMLRPETASR